MWISYISASFHVVSSSRDQLLALLLLAYDQFSGVTFSGLMTHFLGLLLDVSHLVQLYWDKYRWYLHLLLAFSQQKGETSTHRSVVCEKLASPRVSKSMKFTPACLPWIWGYIALYQFILRLGFNRRSL